MAKHTLNRLSENEIEELTKKVGRYIDGGGLHLVVMNTGSTKWVFRFVVGGKQHDMGLGAYPDVGLLEARREATIARAHAKGGRDPIAEREQARRTVSTAADDFIVEEETQATTFKLGGSPADRKIIALEAEVGRLQRELRSSHFDRLNDDAMRALLGNVAETPVRPVDWLTYNKLHTKKHGQSKPEVPVCMLTDWHLGETVDATEVNGCNAYSIKIAERRVQRVTDGIIDLCKKHHAREYPGIVVNLGGDFVSGGLHPELAKTDELESIPAALKARDLMVAALTRFADTFGNVYVPCVAGNHGRNTVRPEFKRYVYKNFDWLIYQLLQRHFANDPRVHIDVRASNDVHYRVFGRRYLLVHGDMLGVKGGDGIIGAIGPIMRGEVKKSGQSAALGLEFDKLLMGHWHQQLWLPRAIVANTLKGFDEFARLALGAKPSRPSQPLWFVHPSRGETSHWDVYADDAPATNNEWVSWRAA